ncbi:hypothetical protein N1032_25405, partial [Herbiconiux sp. CPCC 203386]|nr:hypothetical protein [Herbiconiux daphne]
MLAFAGTRTIHRMACNIEDAGFEIRDLLAWIYSTGFPKSVNIGRAVAKQLEGQENAGAWEGWGSALKPAFEPITLARKPFGGTLTNNVINFGTGALNIGACRVPDNQATEAFESRPRKQMPYETMAEGRWPANLLHDGSAEVVELFPNKGGSAARFFYCPKSSKADRDWGLQKNVVSAEEMVNRKAGSAGIKNPRAGAGRTSGAMNFHPTVKPIAL